MDELAFSSTSGWEVYRSGEDRRAMYELADDYIRFISACKTEREAVAGVIDLLKEAGYTEGFQTEKGWQALHGKAIFVARRGRRPLQDGIRLISAHTDSPRLDLKQRPLQEQVGVGQAKTHYYGGLRKYQWFARPLALHGVIVTAEGRSIPVRLGEEEGDPVFTIADLLPHLSHKDGGLKLSDAFDAEKLNIILGHEPVLKEGEEDAPKEPVKVRMLQLLHEKYGIREDDLISAELEAVPSGPARYVGLDKGIVGGYGQDDRICVYTALRALLDAEEPEYTSCLIFWDKEEIGSDGSTGANSRFFQYCVEDMAAAWEPETPFRSIMMHSRAVSGDVHAAVDPDWQDRHELKNSAFFGHGVAFCKFTGSRGKYGANDAHPEYLGWMRGVLDAKNIPWQMAELGKVDVGGGGTVALFLAAYGMDVVDAGPALLGMHSPFELSSVPDIYSAKLAYQAFFEAK
ncbi:aminopeptidase [Mailhella massiliensis]|uniref:M18 family aminopeptidase n=1 Tax=Mailhella massiliensis TaxID=1903261 RepID=A0A921AYE8_9BACT|nr:aminopeptidase [Mailhella massiliensis]HJD98381.1 aminopeptidase [Mailhella massiliensis]